MEVRDNYDSDTPSRLRFEAGEDLDEERRFDEWRTLIRQATREGRLFRRVRVVSTPLGAHSRFSVRFAALNNEAGEDIRYLTRDRAAALGLPNHDYWLFDSRLLVHLPFDDEDRLLDCEVIEDPAEIVQHNYWRDVAWHHAIRRDDFAAKQGLELIERP